MVNVLPKVNSPMHVEAITTTLHYASKGDAGKTIGSEEALKPNKCSSSCGQCSSCSPHWYRHKGHSSCSHSRTPSCSPSHSPSHGTSPRCSSHSKRCNTPDRYYQDAIDVIPADSITTGNWAEGKLYMESASDGQVAFFTCLTLPAQSGTKTMVVKIDLGTQVNTIPLSRYCTLYPNKLNKSRFPKAKSLMPTHLTWISHQWLTKALPKPLYCRSCACKRV